jgi:hypothetical protein
VTTKSALDSKSYCCTLTKVSSKSKTKVFFSKNDHKSQETCTL